VIYTVSRLLPPAAGLALWAWFRDGTVLDPANLLLLASLAFGVVAFVSVRRYWVIRKTSRSRKDSSLLA
jgi:hypothetical protein